MSTNTPIASQTLTSNTQTVTFNNIPQTYTDLILICSYRDTRTEVYSYPAVRFNSDTGTNYSITRVFGDGSSTYSQRQSNQTSVQIGEGTGANSTAGIYVPMIVQIQNYSNTTTNKTLLSRTSGVQSGGGLNTGATVGLWRNTNAITSITIIPDTGGGTNIASGTTFNLYGIAAGSPKALGGNTVTTDGTYWYHTFTSSGTFTPTQALTADYLVVAGGAGGGADHGGGGGAGGLRCTVGATGGGGSLESPLSLTAQAYAVTVGAGGAGGVTVIGTNGSNSVFSTITSTGGGGGGSTDAQANGATGGSGGGGAVGPSSTNGVGGSGTTNQGYAGGNGAGTNIAAGGGGGANATGVVATSGGAGGNGGAGVASSISGSSVTYAGGGGGGGWSRQGFYTPGTGGAGGGGNGAPSGIATTGVAATVNTGGGGGGGGDANGSGGAGGSGIVIVRYAV